MIARRNVGNAYEDMAYLAGDMASYNDAINVFQETFADANGIGQFDPQSWIDLGGRSTRPPIRCAMATRSAPVEKSPMVWRMR